MNRANRIHALSVAIAVAIALSRLRAAYNKCGFEGCPGDAELTVGVNGRRSRGIRELQPPNMIDVHTIAGVVYLYGLVDTDYQLQMAELIAHQVPGVTKVVNSIGLAGNAR